ncbi:hypothetical protein CDCA_CDCA09G2714 [Cyanidium caldarium]|uniref:Fanconi-associated nuclease n=1 Tax=Cyanidium caldarium TaxID=2771 RepID=A0AAV9IX55_CYACA|nr:hypothetical protein CDCA_CDCA09G2714 [Cyanidium caldarium]
MSEMVQNAKQADIRKYLGARRKGSAASSASCAAGEAPREAWPGRWVQCPVCAERMTLAGVDGHLDVCLDQREVLGRWERSRAGVMGGGCRERLGAEMGDASAPARIWSGEAADECRVGPYAARALLFAVQWVLQYEAHLLHAEEADVLRQVLQLARPARWLLARLLRRQGVGDGRWIRFSDMVRRYADTDVPVAVRELVAAKLARAEPIDAADWTALLPTLTAPERRELCVQLQLRTDSMLETAVRQPMGSGQSAGWSPAQQRLATMALPAVRLAASAWQACQVAFRILQPLGLETVFQTGQCIASPLPNTPDAAIQWAGRPARPLFETRAALDAYQEAAEWERSFEEALTQPSGAPLALAVAERAGAALRSHVTRSSTPRITRYQDLPDPTVLYRSAFTAVGVAASIVWHSVALLERQTQYAEVVQRLELLLDANLALHRRGRQYHRLSLLLWRRLQQPQRALQVCRAALADEFVRVGESVEVAQRAQRWDASLKPALRHWRLATRIPERVLYARALDAHRQAAKPSAFIGFDGRLNLSVEQLALQSYAADGGYRGRHTEGALFTALFEMFLAVPAVMHADVSDAFHAPCQTRPLDWGTEVFAVRRSVGMREQLRRLRALSAAELREYVRQTISCGHDLSLPWDVIVAGMGATVLCAVLERLADDYAYWRGGAPDLILWRDADPPQCKFVEVKGARDRLNERQRAWLCELQRAGAEVEVCRVLEGSSKRARRAARLSEYSTEQVERVARLYADDDDDDDDEEEEVGR